MINNNSIGHLPDEIKKYFLFLKCESKNFWDKIL